MFTEQMVSPCLLINANLIKSRGLACISLRMVTYGALNVSKCVFGEEIERMLSKVGNSHC
jgi:hypothetical protein